MDNDQNDVVGRFCVVLTEEFQLAVVEDARPSVVVFVYQPVGDDTGRVEFPDGLGGGL